MLLRMPQALTPSPLIRYYGINLGAPYRVPTLSIRIRPKQIKVVGPALCQEPVLCVCVCVVCVVGRGGLSCCEYYLQVSTRDVWILITVSEWYICFGNWPLNSDYYWMGWRSMLIPIVHRKIVWEGVDMETHYWLENLLVNCQFLLVYL